MATTAKRTKPVTAKKPVPAKAAKPAPKAKPAPAKKAETAPAVKPKSTRKLKPAKKVKRDIKRVPPRIVRKVVPAAKLQPMEDYVPVDTAKAVESGMSIALRMKRRAAEAEKAKAEEAIRLSRRPTTRATGKDTQKFPAADLKEFRKRLLAAREAALIGSNQMKATGFNEDDDHEADGGDGTNQTLRLQALGQMGNINRTLQRIEVALHRIEDGTYGVCTVCGQLIRKPRLMNQPFVLTCMECQSAMEREGK